MSEMVIKKLGLSDVARLLGIPPGETAGRKALRHIRALERKSGRSIVTAYNNAVSEPSQTDPVPDPSARGSVRYEVDAEALRLVSPELFRPRVPKRPSVDPVKEEIRDQFDERVTSLEEEIRALKSENLKLADSLGRLRREVRDLFAKRA